MKSRIKKKHRRAGMFFKGLKNVFLKLTCKGMLNSENINKNYCASSSETNKNNILLGRWFKT